MMATVLAGPSAFSQAPPAGKFDDLVARAQKAAAENRLEEATALYTRALALRPKWEEGWWSLGTIAYDQDQYRRAAVAFSKALALNPRNGSAHAMLGLCQFELHQDQLALGNLLAAEKFGIVKDQQLRHVTLYHLALLQLRLGKFGAARESLAQLVRDRVETKEIPHGMGLAALLIRAKDAPADGTPGAQVVDQVGQAEVLLFSNQFDLAKQIYDRLAADFPDYPNLHFAYGRFLLETHETDAAVQEFQLELKRDPKHVNSMLEIAMALQLVDPGKGLAFAEKASKLAPQLPLAHYLVGTLRLNSGDAEGAIPELEIAKRSFPEESGVHFALGNAYSRVGRKTEASAARAEFSRLVAKAPKPSGAVIYADRPSRVLSGQNSELEREQPPQ
ncbi:MAG TPA: tetratricopeptide repeat protein [Candidatus Acidoferrum sp.]|nr:tetratricopeptide repeat protein [Candidatus Acidoferrum sp.]